MLRIVLGLVLSLPVISAAADEKPEVNQPEAGVMEREIETTSAPAGKASGPAKPEASTPETAAGKTKSDPAHEAIDYFALLFVFVLATFIGLGVVARVSRLLHTPLMSLTNAISAIAVIGAIIVAGAPNDCPLAIRLMGAVALVASMTNVVSGFLITDRMLKMFKQTRSKEQS